MLKLAFEVKVEEQSEREAEEIRRDTSAADGARRRNSNRIEIPCQGTGF